MKARTIPSLDGLRAISVILVILSHLVQSGALGAWSSALAYVDGAVGVRIFFVISGFLITTILLKDEGRGGIALGKFYLRRFLRLFPVQLAFVVALFVLTITTKLSVTPCQFVTALTYSKNYACGSWIDGHLWSLAVEEQFYLLWPLMLVRLNRRAAVVAALALIAFAPASRAIEYSLGSRVFFWLTSNADGLMIGCLMALAASSYPDRIATVVRKHPTIGRLIAVTLITVPSLLSHHMLLGWFTVTLGPTLQFTAAAYLIASLVLNEGGLSYRALNIGAVKYVGLISYSLYVWQQIFMSQPDVFGLADRPLPLAFPLNVLLALGAGALSFYSVERPMEAVKDRLTARLGRRRIEAAA